MDPRRPEDKIVEIVAAAIGAFVIIWAIIAILISLFLNDGYTSNF